MDRRVVRRWMIVQIIERIVTAMKGKVMFVELFT